MHIDPIQTHLIQPGENILQIVDTYFPQVQEREILVLTSKILSICEGQIVEKTSISKKELIQREADAFLEEPFPNPYDIILTIKNGFLIPSAGIDESNAQKGYILYPKDLQKSVCQIWNHIRQTQKRKEVGILITDSHTTPLRRGVTGLGIGWCGFEPLYSYIGTPDLFGRALKVTVCNILDALGAAAVFTMGEGREQTPLAIIREAPKISFLDRMPTEQEIASLRIPLEEDLYAPLLAPASWRKGGET